jgi:hypothetical protein
MRADDERVIIKFKSEFNRMPTRQSIAHSNDAESAIKARAELEAMALGKIKPKASWDDRLVALCGIVSIVTAGILKERELGATDIACLTLTSLMMFILLPEGYAVYFRLGPSMNRKALYRARKFLQMIKPPNDPYNAVRERRES